MKAVKEKVYSRALKGVIAGIVLIVTGATTGSAGLVISNIAIIIFAIGLAIFLRRCSDVLLLCMAEVIFSV